MPRHGKRGGHCKRRCRRRVLSQLRPGESAIICGLEGCGGCKKRLLELGLLPGQRVLLERVGPLGDPIEIKVRGYHLTLRRGQADGVCLHQEEPYEEPAQA